MPTKKRDWMLTAAGTRYTYAGWVRAYNAALKNSGSPVAYRLAESYPDHYNKHYEQLRKRDLGSRQHAPSPGVPRPATRKPATRKPATSVPLKPGQYRTIGGKVRAVPTKPKKPAPKKTFTPRQRELMAKVLRLDRRIERQKHRQPLSHVEKIRLDIASNQKREAELHLNRLSESAGRALANKLREQHDRLYNRRMRDIKKKEAFQKGKFTAGSWL